MVCVCLMVCEARYLMCVRLCACVCGAEQKLFPPPWLCYMKYTYSMYQRCYTKEVSLRLHLCTSVCVYVCVAALLSMPKAVSADVLLCRLMADYDIKCL